MLTYSKLRILSRTLSRTLFPAACSAAFRRQEHCTSQQSAEDEHDRKITQLGKLSLEGVQELRKFCSKQKSNFTVSIEGNIGCGKSTLLNYYSSCPNVEALKEPVDKWCNLRGHNALDLLYKDSARWSFSFNNYAMLTRLEMHRHIAKQPVKMLERSLYSTRYVFVQNSVTDGVMTKLEDAVLQEWFDHIITTENCGVDLFVYLRASPEICYERIKKRARSEEACVPIEFIQKLHELHEDWLIKKVHGEVPGKLLILDASHELPQMTKLYDDMKNEILCGCT